MRSLRRAEAYHDVTEDHRLLETVEEDCNGTRNDHDHR